jgi:hypothetical protein
MTRKSTFLPLRLILGLAAALHTMPATAHGQQPLITNPDSLARVAIAALRTTTPAGLNGPLNALQRLYSQGHLAIGSPLFRTVADSLVAIAGSATESSPTRALEAR